MASVAFQLIQEITAHVQSDSLEDAWEMCADSTYLPNKLRASLCPPISRKIIAHCVVYLAEYVLGVICCSHLVNPFTMLIHTAGYSLLSALCAPTLPPLMTVKPPTLNHMLDPSIPHWKRMVLSLQKTFPPILCLPKCFFLLLLEKERDGKGQSSDL